MLSFFPRDVLDRILDLIVSVSEGFPIYSYTSITVFFSYLICFPILRGLEGRSGVLAVLLPLIPTEFDVRACLCCFMNSTDASCSGLFQEQFRMATLTLCI